MVLLLKCVPVAVSSILSADRAGSQSDVWRWHLCKVPGEVAYLLQAESPERKLWPHPDRWTGKRYADIKWIIPIIKGEFVLEPNCKPMLVKNDLWIILYFQDGTVTCPPSCSFSTSCHHHLKAATRDRKLSSRHAIDHLVKFIKVRLQFNSWFHLLS